MQRDRRFVRRVCPAALRLAFASGLFLAAPAGAGDSAVGGRAVGGPGAAKTQAGAAEKETPEIWAKKDLGQMNLEELRAFQSFTYTSGGRDPFTFRLPTESPKKEKKKEAPKEEAAAPPVNVDFGPPKVTEEDKRIYLAEQEHKVRMFMLDHQYPKAIQVGEDVRAKVMDDWGGVPTSAENNMLWRRILRFQRTARRLRQQQEVRAEFAALPIVVRGIRWTPRSASALVNGEVYEPGEVLGDVGGAEVQIQIEAIDEDAVVFLYKGLRFRKGIGAGAQNDAPGE